MGGGGANGGPPSDAPVQGKVGAENYLRAAGNRRRGTFALSAGSAPLGRALMYFAGYSRLAPLPGRSSTCCGTLVLRSTLSVGTPLDIWLVTLAWIFFDLLYVILFRSSIGYGTTLLLWYPRLGLPFHTCSRITGVHSIGATTCLDLSCLCRPTAHAYRWEC